MKRFYLILILLILGGCSGQTGQPSATPTQILANLPSQGREIPAVLSYFDEPVVITAPPTVNVNTPFELHVTSYGSGCESAGGMRVEQTGVTTIVNVYDYTTRSLETPCTEQLKRFTHSITLQFSERGEALIMIKGVRVGNDTPSMDGRPATFEHRIIVQ